MTNVVIEEAKKLFEEGRFDESSDLILHSIVKLKTKKDLSAVLNLYVILVQNFIVLGEMGFIEGLENAKKYGKEALEYVKGFESSNETQLVEVLSLQGEVYRHSEDYKTAEEYYVGALEIIRKNDITDVENSITCFSSLSIIYKKMKEFEKCEKILNEALDFTKIRNLDDDQARVNFELGSLFEAKDDFEKSIELYNLSLGQYRTKNNLEGQIHVLFEMGHLYEKLNEKSEYEGKSLEMILKAEKLIETTEDDEFVLKKCVIYNKLGNHYLSKENEELAWKYFEKEYDLIRERRGGIGSLEHLLDCLSHFNTICEEKEQEWLEKCNNLYLRGLDSIEQHYSNNNINNNQDDGEEEEENKKHVQAFILTTVGGNFLKLKKFENSKGCYEDALIINKSTGDLLGTAFCLKGVGESFMGMNKKRKYSEEAKERLGESKKIFQSLATTGEEEEDWSEIIEEIESLILSL